VTGLLRLAVVCLAVVAVLAVAATAFAGHVASDRFSGHGGRILPPLRFPHAVTLHWRADDGLTLVGIEAPRAFGSMPRLVASHRRTGTVVLPPGVYRLRVVTVGVWAVTIV
jgi:hypothetical protein